MRILITLFALSIALCACTSVEETQRSPKPLTPSKENLHRWIREIGTFDGEQLLLPLRALIVNLTHEEVLAALISASKDSNPQRRSNAAYVLGHASRSEAAKGALLAMANDPVQNVRYEVASSLGAFRVKAAIPVLIEGLFDQSAVVRSRCVHHLRVFTLKYFHYHPNDLKSKRDFFAAKWRRWWSERAPTFQFPHRRG